MWHKPQQSCAHTLVASGDAAPGGNWILGSGSCLSHSLSSVLRACPASTSALSLGQSPPLPSAACGVWLYPILKCVWGMQAAVTSPIYSVCQHVGHHSWPCAHGRCRLRGWSQTMERVGKAEEHVALPRALGQAAWGNPVSTSALWGRVAAT